MKKTKNTKVTKTLRTSAGLRDVLFDELDTLRSGESNASRANAVAKLAGGVMDTVKMEIDAQKHLSKTQKPAGKQDIGLGSPLALGSA